jgi:F420-dependent oxidoreductase-like protein
MASVGIMIEGQEGLTWNRWRRIAEAVERLGFESLWRSDHLFSLFDVPDRPGLDTWASLTALAMMTRRIRFGPLVCPMTFRHPSLLAREAAAVDVLSGGRLELGVGAGWHEREHQAFGVPYPPIGERFQRLVEGLQVIRALWQEGPAHVQGRYYSLQGAAGWPKPVRQSAMPIIVGGRAPRALRIAARYADEWNCAGNLSPAQVRERVEILDEACRAAGRDPRTLRRSWMGAFLIGANGSALERRARAVQSYLPALADTSAAALPGVLRQRGWLVGSAQEIADQMRALVAEGISRFMLQMFDQEDEEALHMLAEGVVPRVA